MDASAAREVRYLRRSLAWTGVVLLGIALLVSYVLGAWSTHVSAGAQPVPAPPVQTAPFNPWPLVGLVVSLALVVGGVVGLMWQRRSFRRRGLSADLSA